MRNRLFFGVIAIGLSAVGCQTCEPPPDSVPLGYVSARLYDLMDVFELNAGADVTADNLFGVVAVEPLAAGGGYYDSEKIGMQGRQFGRWRETRTEMNFVVDCLIHYDKTPRRGNRYLFDELYAPSANSPIENNLPFREWGLSHRLFDTEHKPLDLTAELYVVFLGLDVGVSPVELLDFVGGLFTFDEISADDWMSPRDGDTSAVAARVPQPEPVDAAPPVPTFNADSEFSHDCTAAEEDQEEPVFAAGARPTMIITMESVPAVEMEPPESLTAADTAPALSPAVVGEPAVVAAPAPASEEMIILSMETQAVESGTDNRAPAAAVSAGAAAGAAPPPVAPGAAATPKDPDAVIAAYEERFQQTSFREPDQLFALALWCRENNLPRKADRHLRQTIALNPNHEDARLLLGYVRFRGTWVLDTRKAEESKRK